MRQYEYAWYLTNLPMCISTYIPYSTTTITDRGHSMKCARKRYAQFVKRPRHLPSQVIICYLPMYIPSWALVGTYAGDMCVGIPT